MIFMMQESYMQTYFMANGATLQNKYMEMMLIK